MGRWIYSPVNCRRCGKLFDRRTGTQLYCGFYKDKNFCNYKSAQDRLRSRWIKNYEKLKHKRLTFRFKILAKYEFTCQYCGRKAPEVKLEIDHIFSRSKGGKNEEANYTVACSDCNGGKRDLVLSKFENSRFSC